MTQPAPVRSYMTHPFRPIVGNSVFCADCPRGSSFGSTHPWHAGEPAVSLEQAVAELERSHPRRYHVLQRRCHALHTDRLYWSEEGVIACGLHAPYLGSDTWVWERWEPVPADMVGKPEPALGGDPPHCETCGSEGTPA